MNGFIRTLTVMVVALLLTACATMAPDFETPSLSVSSFRSVPSEGMAPRFEIGLRIVNPNARPLPLRGLVYRISLEGYQLVTGVANDLPTIAAYSDAEVVVTAQADLLGGMRLISDLLQRQREQFQYRFSAKLDVGRLAPALEVVDEGAVSLQPNPR